MNEWYFSGIAWYYGDNDFTIWTTLHVQLQHAWLAVSDTDSHMTCSTDTGFSRDLQYLIQTLVWLVVKIQLFMNYVQQQGFPVAYHTFTWVISMIYKQITYYSGEYAILRPSYLPARDVTKLIILSELATVGNWTRWSPYILYVVSASTKVKYVNKSHTRAGDMTGDYYHERIRMGNLSKNV